MKLPRNKFNPYYILVLLVWGDHEGVTRYSGSVLKLLTGPLSRSLRITTDKMRIYFGDLEKIGLLEIIEDGWGSMTVRVKAPPGWESREVLK